MLQEKTFIWGWQFEAKFQRKYWWCWTRSSLTNASWKLLHQRVKDKGCWENSWTTWYRKESWENYGRSHYNQNQNQRWAYYPCDHVPKYPVDFVNNCASTGFIGVEIFKLVINYCLIYIIKQLGIEDWTEGFLFCVICRE